MTKDLNKAISTRSRLRNVSKKTQEPSDILKYKKQRNFVKNLNLKTKRNYYKSLDPKKCNTSKTFWKTFKPMFSQKYVPAEKFMLVEDGEIIGDDKILAETMNNYFSNITKTLNVKSWPEQTMIHSEDKILTAINKFRDHPSIIKIKSMIKCDKKFEFQHILPETLKSKVNTLDASKSTGGNIPINMIKETIDLIIAPLTDCLNSSINDGIFPQNMKLADITPIFKKYEKLHKKNYRGISLLSAFSKVYERILVEPIIQFMQNKISDNLCGFRQNYSTEDALLQLLENWRKHLDKQEIVGAIACDLSKAFDTIPHDLIIAKLEAYGFGYNALKLISSYLTNRMQRCKVGSEFSSWVELLIGFPQGSVLGPILFNIFINDFLFFTSDSYICNFADDQTIYCHHKSIESVTSQLETDIALAITWFRVNSLVPNPDKFQLMILGTRKRLPLCLEINGQRTISTFEMVLLGITIDWKLNFNIHAKLVCDNVSKKVSALVRLRTTLSMDQKLILLDSYVMSQFNYCSNVWMFYGKVVSERIDRIHERALRAVYNDFSSSFSQLLSKGDHVTVHQKNLKTLCLKVFKAINGYSPKFINSMLTEKLLHHDLRIQNLLNLPKTSTITYGLHSFTYRSTSTWNTISDEVKNSASVFACKRKLK